MSSNEVHSDTHKRSKEENAKNWSEGPYYDVNNMSQSNEVSKMEVSVGNFSKSVDPLFWKNKLNPGVILEKMASSDPSCIYTIKLYGVENLPSSRPVQLKNQLKANIKNLSDIIEVKYTRVNSIMISTKSINTAYELLNIKRLFDIDIITSIQMETITTRFLIHNIPTEVTMLEIVEELAENDLIPINIRRFKRNDRPSTTVLITMLGKKIPDEIKLWFQIFHPQLFIDKPSQCMRCFKYTHRTLRCPVKTPICRNCGGLHIIEVCNMPRSCINCGGDHDPTDRACYTYNLECKIMKYKSENHVPFHIARKACTSKKSSYAALICSYEYLPFAHEIRHDMNSSSYIQSLTNQLETLELQVQNLKKLSSSSYPKVKKLNYSERKRILVTGGAGFVGSHLVDKLMTDGHEVTVVDNFFTGSKKNIDHWFGHANFELIRHDIVNPLYIEVDQIYHLASPASPPHYMFNPVKTIKTNTVGTINLLGLARRVGARILIASTSEVYGDPEVHPQSEDYWGHVNPIGPRSCYDEGKRVAEALSYAYEKQEKVSVRVARIFNTYGPRMHINDGRVVSNFILQALQNHSITIYGDGKHTRSFQYISDLVDGLTKLMNSNYTSPINIGNPEEYTIEEFATVIKNIVGGTSPIVKQTGVPDDPQRRKPDIKRAKLYLGWSPKVSLKDGLQKTVKYFQKELLQENAKASS